MTRRRCVSVSFSIAVASAIGAVACSLIDPIIDATSGAQSLMAEVQHDAETDSTPPSEPPGAQPGYYPDATSSDAGASDAGEPDTSCTNPTVFTFDFTTYPPMGFVEDLRDGGSLAHVVDDGHETEGGAVAATLTTIPNESVGAHVTRLFDTPGRSLRFTYSVKLTPVPSDVIVNPGCYFSAGGDGVGLLQEKNVLYVRGSDFDGGRVMDVTETKWHSVSIRTVITKSYEGYSLAEVDGVPVKDPLRLRPGPSADASFSGVNVGCGGYAYAYPYVDATTTVLVDDVRLEICP